MTTGVKVPSPMHVTLPHLKHFSLGPSAYVHIYRASNWIILPEAVSNPVPNTPATTRSKVRETHRFVLSLYRTL